MRYMREFWAGLLEGFVPDDPRAFGELVAGWIAASALFGAVVLVVWACST